MTFKVAFHYADKQTELQLASAFLSGVARAGHRIEFRLKGSSQEIGNCDLACMVGVKSKELWEASRAAGARTMMFDKGYIRSPGGGSRWQYWRVSLDAHHPTRTTLMREAMPHDRLEALGLRLRPMRRAGDSVLFAGSSEKYHRFYDLPHPTRYAAGVIKALRKRTGCEIVYRPKPSWRDAEPIAGSTFSGGKDKLGPRLGRARCVVTHGSNICFEALLAGVPCVVLGDAVAAPISSTDLKSAREPYVCTEEERSQWLANLAYHQWTESEMRAGEAWDMVERWLG